MKQRVLQSRLHFLQHSIFALTHKIQLFSLETFQTKIRTKMIPRYKCHDVALREKQLLPLAIWLRKLKIASSSNLSNAVDLITNQTLQNRFFYDFIAQRASVLQHVKVVPPIPHLFKFTLLDKHDSDVVSENKEEQREVCSKEFLNRHDEKEENNKIEDINTSKLIQWYHDIIDRPEHHRKRHLQQEISLVEHARWVCQKIANEENYSTTTMMWRPKCIVDVGGGSGYLALMMQQRILPDCETIVIDLQKPKHAIDDDQMNPERRKKFCNPFFRRITKPIEDVNWREDVRYHPDDVLVVSKHLCGGGVDQLLRTFQLQGFHPRGLCLSSCCHFKRLSTESYINPSFIKGLLLDVKHPWIFEVKRRKHQVTAKGKFLRKVIEPEDEFPRNVVSQVVCEDDQSCSSCNVIPQESIEDFLLPITEKMRQYDGGSMKGNNNVNDASDEEKVNEEEDSERKSSGSKDHSVPQYEEQKLESRLCRAIWRIDQHLVALENDVKQNLHKNGISEFDFGPPFLRRKPSTLQHQNCDDKKEQTSLNHDDDDDDETMKNKNKKKLLIKLINDPFAGTFRSREYGKTHQREGMRSLFSAITSRTNWVGTHDMGEVWMQRVGRDLEGILDGGRVEFLRNASNFTHLDRPYSAELVAFIPSDVSPRNRVLLGWRAVNKKKGGYFLTE